MKSVSATPHHQPIFKCKHTLPHSQHALSQLCDSSVGASKALSQQSANTTQLHGW